MENQTINILGVGIGPFNLGLAALTNQHPSIHSKFLESREDFKWHQGLLLENTTLQVPFFADLVTMADPTHPLSYLNYLHKNDRLYQFYYYEHFLIPRLEYNHYCRWVAQQLENCQFGEKVYNIQYQKNIDKFLVLSETKTGKRQQYISQNLAIGIGTKPHLPQWQNNIQHPLVKHSSEFAYLKEQLEKCKEVTIVGSGQSAAECVLALFSALTPERVSNGASIRWITRSPGFHPMEFSKLGQECFTPSYMTYFQDLNKQKRLEIAKNQGNLYRGISFSTIADIYDLLYQRSIGGQDTGLYLFSNCDIKKVEVDDTSKKLTITFDHTTLEQTHQFMTDAIIFATGYTHQWPEWFEDLKNTVLSTDEENDYIIQKDFTALRCDNGSGKVFIQNTEIFQQGVGAPDLGIGGYRNAIIMNQLLKYEAYHIPKATSFQCYGLPY